MRKFTKKQAEELLGELGEAVEEGETVGEFSERIARVLGGNPGDTIRIGERGIEQVSDEPVEEFQRHIRRVVKRHTEKE